MAKTKKEGATPKTPAERAAIALAAVKKIGPALRDRPITSIILITMIAFAIIATLPAVAPATAMLYLFGNNGKLSGRADGNVYMRNGVVRGFSVPALVQNAFTTLQRVLLSSFSSAWNGLTQAQMLTWKNASGFFTSNRFGQQVEVKGKTLYTRLNTNLAMIGEAAIDDAPAPEAIVQPITNTFASLTVAAFSVAFTATPVTGSAILVFATAQMSPGTFNPSESDFKLLGDFGDTSPLNIHAAYLARFGARTVGRKIFVKLVAVNEVTGQASSGIVQSGLVA